MFPQRFVKCFFFVVTVASLTLKVIKKNGENEEQRWALETIRLSRSSSDSVHKLTLIVFVTQIFFLTIRLLFSCHYNCTTRRMGLQLSPYGCFVLCSGQCSNLTDVINKNLFVKKNSFMSKLNKYYAWKHVSLSKYTKPINDCFSSVYAVICQGFSFPTIIYQRRPHYVCVGSHYFV